MLPPQQHPDPNLSLNTNFGFLNKIVHMSTLSRQCSGAFTPPLKRAPNPLHYSYYLYGSYLYLRVSSLVRMGRLCCCNRKI